jgi:hypothetical protein
VASKRTFSDGVDAGATAPPPRSRIKLATVKDVSRELGRLYREARTGRVATQDASRLANMLSILGRLIEGSDLEARLDALERSTHKESRPWPTSH